jgi:3-oxoacyl-[acyl-carrier-protein] synthase III
MKNNVYMNVSGIGVSLGESYPISALKELQSQLDVLEAFRSYGLESYCKSDMSPLEHAAEAVNEMLDKSHCDPGEIDYVIYATTSFWKEDFYRRGEISNLLRLTELKNAYPIAITLSECANLHSALKVACGLISSSQANKIVLVSSDCVAPGISRIVPPRIGVKSDGAAAVLLQSEPAECKILNVSLKYNSELGSIDPNEQIERYMSGVAEGIVSVFRELYKAAGRQIDQYRNIVINNYNLSVSRSLANILGVEECVLSYETLPDIAHLAAADNIINLSKLNSKAQIKAGDRIAVLGSAPNMWGVTALEGC